MKHTKNIFLAAMLLFTLSVSAQKGKQLTILHTNDTHSTILPLKENLADTMKAGRAGFLRRIAMIKEERKKDPELLLFDSGDFSQGSAYYTLFKGDVEIGLMNRMGYDCSTIGNHEFDFGMENMARLFKMANFPIVCSNYDFTGTILEGLVKPYIILHRKGIKIGVFALDPKMEGLVFAKNCQGIKYLDPIKVANEMAFKLKHKEKCDLVICVSHLGWEPITQMGDPMMISHSRNIDLVLGGHSHSYFLKPQVVKNADGKDVPVDQNGKHAIFVGKLVLNME
ncbi:MAG: bifunctional metallophosphatase/5'-nucleotidase [Prevotella sp.]|nr:bifunctional metallophosphatase/5'-nucleotidase [Prevotella sp.]